MLPPKLGGAADEAARVLLTGASVAGKDGQIALLTRERDEALAREAATSEILKIISSSPGELVPVFQAILENAVRSAKQSSERCFASMVKNFIRWPGTMYRPP